MRKGRCRAALSSTSESRPLSGPGFHPDKPTGTHVRSFVIGGPVTGEQTAVGGSFGGPCQLLGPGPHPLNLEFQPHVGEDKQGNHGFRFGFGLDELAEVDQLDGVGVFRPSPRGPFVVGELFLSVAIGQAAGGALTNFCEATLIYDADKL